MAVGRGDRREVGEEESALLWGHLRDLRGGSGWCTHDDVQELAATTAKALSHRAAHDNDSRAKTAITVCHAV